MGLGFAKIILIEKKEILKNQALINLTLPKLVTLFTSSSNLYNINVIHIFCIGTSS